MFYTYFEIENFKGIKKLRLDLAGPPSGRIQTLVGLNESGKTTILEAIDLFSSGAEELSAHQLAGRIRPNENDLVPIAQRANFNGKIRIQAGVRLEDADKLALKEYMLRNHQYMVTSIADNFEITDEYSFAKSLYTGKKSTSWTNVAVMGRKQSERRERNFDRSRYPTERAAMLGFLKTRMPAIWYFPNFLFDFPARIYLRPQANESNTDRFYRALLQDILDALDLDGATVEDHLLARTLSDEPGDRRALDNIVLLMARRLSTDVFNAWRQILQRPVSMDIRMTAQVDNQSGNPEPYLELHIVDTDGYYSVNDRSLGFRWFFVFLLLTTFRGYRRESARELLYLLDEPASNLHPNAQAQLLQCLDRVTRRSRVIYTTHSHHLINPDWLENTFVIRNVGASGDLDILDLTASHTDVRADKYRTFVASHPDQSQYFQPVLEVLDYKPSRLEMVPELVLVEGKNDFYALRLAELNLGLSPTELHFYPGDGAGTLDNVIALYIAWGRNFLVLLDSDTEGKRQKDRYLKRFGEILKDRIFTVDDLSAALASNALDAAFQVADRQTIAAHLGLPANALDNKKAFFRGLQEVVATRSGIVLSAEASRIFTDVLQGLRNKLNAVSII